MTQTFVIYVGIIRDRCHFIKVFYFYIEKKKKNWLLLISRQKMSTITRHTYAIFEALLRPRSINGIRVVDLPETEN